MRTLLFISFLLISILTFSQVVFEKTYNSHNEDERSTVHQTLDGGYIIAGGTENGGNMLLIKTNYLGDTIWTKQYGGANDDYCFAMQITSDGGYILAGKTNSFGQGNYDIYIVKTNNIGDTLWTKTYGGIYYDQAYSIAETFDNGYIITGAIANYNTGNTFQDLYVIRTNNYGDTIWTKIISSPNSEAGMSVIQTSDSLFVIAGGQNNKIFVVKMNDNGDTILTKTYSSLNNEIANSIIENNNGNYVLTGSTRNITIGNEDYFLFCINPNGDSLWYKTFSNINGEFGNTVIQTSDNGYAIIGSTVDFPNSLADIYFIKTNYLGDTLWTKKYSSNLIGHPHNIGNSIEQTDDMGFIILGYSGNIGASNSYYYLIKTNELGISDSTYLGTSIMNNENIIYVFPNPCSSQSTIEFINLKCDDCCVKFYNSQGQFIYEIKNIYTNHITINSDAFKSGLYLYQIFNRQTLILKNKLIIN